jgi:hypothetical protein
MTRIYSLLFLLLSLAALAQDSPTQKTTASPQGWATPTEAADYRTTPRFDETMAYLHRLQQAAPKVLKIEVFGKSGEGRDLVAVIASKDGVFDPAALHRANRPIMLIQNSIHAGEMDGKDSCLALLRDIVITKSKAALLDKAVLVILPMYNVDGHERRSPYNRINQNGPEEMGWRTTSVNLNLNRDYLKADTVETRAFLRLWTRWLPDFFVDDHVTDGADFQYDTTYSISSGPDVYPPLAEWITKSLLPYTEQSVNNSGHVIGPYIAFADESDPGKGIPIFQDLPRFSTGFTVLENRPGLLVEMHMLKDYKTRVTGNYEILRAMLEVINRDAEQLVRMNRENDAATIAAGRDVAGRTIVPLLVSATGRTEPFLFRGYKFERSLSEVSGAVRIEYSKEPANITIPRQNEMATTRSVTMPRAYIIPAEWTTVIDVLAAHGIEMMKTSAAWTSDMQVELYRCPRPQWLERPFEGRHLASFDNGGAATDAPGGGAATASSGAAKQKGCKFVREKMTFPAGSVVVPMDQRAAKVALHFLEPEGPDSAVTWGFFDAIFEQKEYGEGYVVEKLAREMMAKDPKLKEEFEARLASDHDFAASPSERLNFFYKRSPYWDSHLGLYPVGRVLSLDGIPLEKSAKK